MMGLQEQLACRPMQTNRFDAWCASMPEGAESCPSPRINPQFVAVLQPASACFRCVCVAASLHCCR